MLIYNEIKKSKKSKTVTKKSILLPICFLLGLCFSISCEKDIDINSDSKPFPIVYGLLDANDSIHYIKVYKSYLVEGNAYDVVKDIDKYSYKDSVDVYLIEYNEKGDSIRTIRFDTTTSIQKNEGLFGHPTQILYKTHTTLFTDFSYKLIVKNKYTNDITTTKESIFLASPPSIRESITQTSIHIPEKSKDFKFWTGKNATKYFLQIKYFYTENLYDGTSRQPEPIIWVLGNVSDPSTQAGQEKSLLVGAGADFFRRLNSEIKEDPNVRIRHTDSLIYEVYAAARDFDMYLRSNVPSTGVNQEKLYYSNLTSYNAETAEEQYAIGFFSSRTMASKWYRDLGYPSTKDSLFYGRYTGHLRFTDTY